MLRIYLVTDEETYPVFASRLADEADVLTFLDEIGFDCDGEFDAEALLAHPDTDFGSVTPEDLERMVRGTLELYDAEGEPRTDNFLDVVGCSGFEREPVFAEEDDVLVRLRLWSFGSTHEAGNGSAAA